MLLSLYLAVLDDQSNEEQFIAVYNTYKRLVYHTAYKIMGDSYLAEDVLQEVFLYVAKNFSKIHRENCHELAAYLVSCSRSRAYDMLRNQREELLEEVSDAPDGAPVPDDAAVSADNFLHVYSSKGSGKGYTVRCSIIQPGQQSSFDNEHTTYENVKVGDADATLGTSVEKNGDTVYILSWEQRGISNTIMGNISQDEIARIAENIFNMSLHVIC